MRHRECSAPASDNTRHSHMEKKKSIFSPRRLLERRPYAQPSQLTSCATSKAKADLGAYDFDDWMGKNKD